MPLAAFLGFSSAACGFSVDACGFGAGVGPAARFGGTGTLAGCGAAVSLGAGSDLDSSEPKRRFNPSQLEPEPEFASTAEGEATVDAILAILFSPYRLWCWW